MFDIGFTEILSIMVVALVVIGPERLPKVAHTMGQWWGRIQRYINKVKQDVGNSIELEELREIERKAKANTEALERSVRETGDDIGSNLALLEKELEHPGENRDATPSHSALPPERS
ncbi:MAG: Sec-independent protein translocase protein TatB [Sideroxydans sp.]|jgi:sec-independent protein translocase protein TatB